MKPFIKQIYKNKTIWLIVSSVILVAVGIWGYQFYSEFTRKDHFTTNTDTTSQETKTTGTPICTFDQIIAKKKELDEAYEFATYRVEPTKTDIRDENGDITTQKITYSLILSEQNNKQFVDYTDVCQTDVTERYKNILSKIEKNVVLEDQEDTNQFELKNQIDTGKFLQTLDSDKIVVVDLLNATAKVVAKYSTEGTATLVMGPLNSDLIYSVNITREECINPGCEVEIKKQLADECKNKMDGLWAYNITTGKVRLLYSSSCYDLAHFNSLN